MKNRRSFIKLALVMLLGAVIGMSGNIIVAFFGDGMTSLAGELGAVLESTGLIVESVLAVSAAAIVIGIYIYMNRLWKMEQESEDEAADEYGEKFEHWAQIGITIADCMTGVLLIFGCCVFPSDFSPSGEDAIILLILSAVMILGCGFMAVMEIMLYHLMQKRDPQKKGDPSSFSFNKKWLEGCDETEKLVLYQAGYKAYGCVQVALLVGLILAIFGEAQFGTGKFPIILVGVIWIMGVSCFGIWNLKGLKRGKERRER